MQVLTGPAIFQRNLPIALLSLVQACVPPIVAGLCLFIATRLFGVPFNDDYARLEVVVLMLGAALLQPQRNLEPQAVADQIRLAGSVLVRWVILIGMLLAVGFATKQSTEFSRLVISTWALGTPLILIATAYAMQEQMRRVLSHPANSRRAVFVGYNQNSLSLASRLQRFTSVGLNVVGFFDDRDSARLGLVGNAPLRGRLTDLVPYVQRNSIDVIFVALPVGHISRVRELLDELRDTTVSIYYIPDINVFDLIQARSSELVGVPVIAMCETPFQGYQGVIKRMSDIILSSVLLLLAAPAMLIIALLIKCSSTGPAIFKQRRYGLDGHEITVYKFRTMTVTEDGHDVPQATKDDRRVTALGRFLRRRSLDELPQLINVLQGRMSLVGPRPHAVAHNQMYRKLIKGYMIRHKVAPGITGLAQVHGLRGETQALEQMEARVRYDLEYLRRWSVLLDLKIIGKTIMIVIHDRNAY